MKYYISKIINKLNISSVKNSNIDKTSEIGVRNNIINTTISRYSYLGNSCIIVNAKIGSFCSIANNCIIGGGNHPINWLSTSPVFYKGNNVLKKNFSNHIYVDESCTSIGNDVWIGNNVLIKAGIKIGDGAIIGMGSVVTKDVGNYEVWAGNPAKLIKKRFEEKDILKLSNSKWWNYEEEKLFDIATYSNNIEKILEIIEKEE